MQVGRGRCAAAWVGLCGMQHGGGSVAQAGGLVSGRGPGMDVTRSTSVE